MGLYEPDRILWEDPPPTQTPLEAQCAVLVERLRERPGQWAKVGEFPKADQARTKGRKLEERGAEFTIRKHQTAPGGSRKDGERHRLYAWVPADSPPEPVSTPQAAPEGF